MLQTFEANYGELQQLKLILWGTEVPAHQLTAVPPEETAQEEDFGTVCTAL